MKLLATLVFIGLLVDFTYSCKCQKIQCNGDGPTGGNTGNTPSQADISTPTKHWIPTTFTPTPWLDPTTPKTTTTTTITTTSITKTIPTTTPTIPVTTTTLATPNTTMATNITDVCQKAYGPRYNKGEQYNGTVDITESGFTCQNWTSQSPHNHHYSYLGDHNYCRNPDGKHGVWCYTTNINKTWEFCDVPFCDCDVTEFTCLSDNYCVPEYYICDYGNNCRDGSDEGAVCDDIFGEWIWGNWTECSATCGIGAKSRIKTCSKNRCRRTDITEETIYCQLPSCGPFIEQKCFVINSNITILDLGQNWHNQKQKPLWTIIDDGRHLHESENTRPSVGLSNLGKPSEPVSFSGTIFSTDNDDDVMGVVFGFWNETSFFVVASAQNRYRERTNWYVGRLHATCGQSCATQRTISNAIWWPQNHPEDITVLATGSTYWENGYAYNFTICFNPSKLLLAVNVTGGNQTEPILESGIISAEINDTGVDEISRNGGYVGVYVDSQARSNWNHLNCQECDLIT